MTFRPHSVSLPAAAALVRKRLGLAEGDHNPLFDAIRVGALAVYVGGAKRGGAWYSAADVWWQNPLAPNSRPGSWQVPAKDIMVRSEEVDRLWPDNPSTPTSPAEADPKVIPVRKGSGGRNPKYDWVGAVLELARLDGESGTANKSQADLVRHLQGWFGRDGGDIPDDSELKRHVRRFLDALSSG
jgi:hypothetical protein